MNLSGFSQKGYPYQTIINGDTVAVLHIRQIRQLNLKFAHWDECREMNDSMRSQIGNYKNLSDKQAAYIRAQEEQMGLLESIRTEQNSQIKGLEKSLKVQKRKKNLTFIAVGILAAGVLLK